MLFSFTSRIISAITAFLYPGYASYKTLSQRPASEEELERWLMYWSVLGCIVGVEYLAEWLVSWIPFYSTIKAIFLLYLALPQTQGATYVYQVHLRPFFAKHEHQIDQTIAEVRARAYRFLQEKVRAVWQAALGALAPGTEAATQNMAGPTQPPPTLNNPASGPAHLISSLWTSYGPSILAGGAAFIRQTAAATLPATGVGAASGSALAAPGSQRSVNALNTPPGSIFNGRSSDQTAGRRRLDAELDQLSSSLPMAPQLIPRANNPAFSSGASSSSPSLRERTISGRFEEIKHEGYEVDGDEFVGGFVPQQPTPSRGSWFGWGQGPRKDGYERVKTE